MLDNEFALESRTVDGRLEIDARGAWTAELAEELSARLAENVRNVAPGTELRILMGGISSLDTYGACILARFERDVRARGARVAIVGLPERFAELVSKVEAAGKINTPQPAAFRWSYLYAAAERGLSGIAEDGVRLINLLGAVVQSLLNTFRRPHSFRMTSTVHQLDRVGWQAVPIVLLNCPEFSGGCFV